MRKTMNQEIKNLAISLAKCQSEASVKKALEDYGVWDNLDDWRFYGDNENNFSTIGNQQSSPDSSLVEKIMNGVDAMLMLRCLKEGIDPEDNNAPQSTRQALIDFFNIYDGKLSNISARERTELANNILLISTGKKLTPCFTIVDMGEGQTPQTMPDTLLSLNRSNKLRIPFVQGKFNMGGSGALQFAGQHNLQLIISKRHPDIADKQNDPTANLWGVTVIRRVDPRQNIRSSAYKYLAPNGNVLSFASNSLPIIPGDYPAPYGENMEHGTFIKLYDYDIGNLRTNIVFDLYNRLSLLMPRVALPIRFVERRKGYRGHSFETTLAGLTVRLEDDRRENLETGFPVSGTITVDGMDLGLRIFAFKRDKSEKYKKKEGIIFTINGQTHGSLSKAFFERKAVGMQYLSDSLIATLDCSNMAGRAREDLFMNSRDRLRNVSLLKMIEKSLTNFLANHPGLKELRERRRREEIESKLGDSKPLADMIEDILKNSPTLSKLFIEGLRIKNPFDTRGTKAKDNYESKLFPTFFKLKKEFSNKKPKLAHVNKRFMVQYVTDAENDYFSRDTEPGTFRLFADDTLVEEKSINLWNGIASLNVTLPHNCTIDSVIQYKTIIDDPSRAQAFEEEFFVKVIKPGKKHDGEGKERKDPSDDKSGDDTDSTSKLALPHIIKVRSDEWAKHEFNEYSALKVLWNGTSYDYKVNVDNVYLLNELKHNSKIDPQLLEARYVYGLALIGISLINEENGPTKNGEKETDDEAIFNTIYKVTKSVSIVLLPMISALADLNISKSKGITIDDFLEPQQVIATSTEEHE